MENKKALIEKRNELVEKMSKLFEVVETEKRAFNDEEVKAYEDFKNEVAGIDKTLQLSEESRKYTKVDEKVEDKKVDMKLVEERAFVNFIRTGKVGYKEDRADVNMTFGDNGAIVPTSIAKRIIETVKDICPIYSLSDAYNVKGTLNFPVYDEGTNAITCDFATEFTALESKVGKFTSIALGGYLAGALAKISKSLINNEDFDVASYIIAKLSQAISLFIEKQCLIGDGTKTQGVVVGATKVVTSASATAITSDEVLALSMKVPQVHQANACFIMNTNTLLALRQLKDSNGRYLLQDDITKGFGFMLLGHPVYTSDTMADIGSAKAPIVFGNLKGLATNLRPAIEVQVLNETYATEHAVGVVGWVEFDSKVVDKQMVAVLKCKA